MAISLWPGTAGVMTTALVGLVTVTLHCFLMPLCEVTVIVAAPRDAPVTTPLSSTATMLSSSLTQVKSSRLPKLELAGMTLSSSVAFSPMTTLAVSGMVKSCTGAMTVTFSVSRVPLPSLAVTVMVTSPGARPVMAATPSSPAETVAIAGSEEVQSKLWATFCVEPSLS